MSTTHSGPSWKNELSQAAERFFSRIDNVCLRLLRIVGLDKLASSGSTQKSNPKN